MAKQNSVNLDITNNADGFTMAGGTTPRSLGVSGGDVLLVGSGSATLTFPTTSTTIAGLGVAQTFTAQQQFSAGISASGSTFNGTLTTTGLVTFNSGISASAGSSFSNATVYITNANTNIDPLFVQHSSTGALKVSTSGQARSGAIKLGNSTTSTFNTFINNSDGTLTFYNGISSTGSNMINFNTTTMNISPTIAGATFSELIRSTSGISASGGITTASYVYAESGFRVGSGAINSQTGTTYTLLAADNGEIIVWNTSAGATLTIPSGLPVGFNATLIQTGTATIGITGSGTTLNSFEGKLRTAGQHAAVSIISYSSNVFNVAGGLTA
jgi:hypothetical protein